MTYPPPQKTDWGAALVMLGVVALVALAVWFTGSLWALLGLFFMAAVRPGCSCPKVPPQCPKCLHQLYEPEAPEDD